MNAGSETRAAWGLQLGQVASGRFVLVSGEWPVVKAQDLASRLGPERVVVRSGEIYHLLSVHRLLAFPAGTSVGDAMAAAGLEAVPALEAGLDAEEAPDRCIVLDEGAVVGFFDVDVDPPDVQRGQRVGEPEPDEIVRLLAVEMKPRVPLGQTVSLLVWLKPPETSSPPDLPLRLPDGSEVDVYVRAPQGFEIIGACEARLLLVADEETLLVRFQLRAVTAGPARIEVLALYESSCLGSIVLEPTVTTEGPAKSPVRYESFLVPPSHEGEPDLTLEIQEVGHGTNLKLLVRLGAPDARTETRTFDPIPVRLEPRQYLNDLFHDIQKLTAGPDEISQKAMALRLASKGTHLCELLLPEDLRELLWRVRHQIRTLKIVSNEAWIPWELCRLSGWDNGSIVESGFFCEWAMARWMWKERSRPAPKLRRMGVIASETAGLPESLEERERLLGWAGADLQVEPVPSRFVDLMENLKSGKYDGLHFAGHGDFRDPDADRSRIVLDDGNELRPEDLSGETANLGATRPLVFLNACQAGRGGLTLTGVGGWAPSFLKAGAAAFLGPVWSVSDRAAGRFAQVFYEQLFQGAPLAEAAQRARLTIRDEFPGNPAWLAYSLFADPLARVVSRDPGPPGPA